ncbi:Agamous-like MADS-box protein agl15 [Rhizophlyctis rosea]|nr:Agamous-like MADS-box protein agl15 [Rhizophlyctis rosea]
MGRRKIHIQKIEGARQRSITLGRRRAGLFKKAHELSVLCECETLVLVFDSRDECHTFASTQDIGSIIARYANHLERGTSKAHVVDATGDYSEEIKVRNSTNVSGSVYPLFEGTARTFPQQSTSPFLPSCQSSSLSSTIGSLSSGINDECDDAESITSSSVTSDEEDADGENMNLDVNSEDEKYGHYFSGSHTNGNFPSDMVDPDPNTTPRARGGMAGHSSPCSLMTIISPTRNPRRLAFNPESPPKARISQQTSFPVGPYHHDQNYQTPYRDVPPAREHQYQQVPPPPLTDEELEVARYLVGMERAVNGFARNSPERPRRGEIQPRCSDMVLPFPSSIHMHPPVYWPSPGRVASESAISPDRRVWIDRGMRPGVEY